MNDWVICTKKPSELEGFRSQISTHFYEHVCVLKHLLVLGGADKFFVLMDLEIKGCASNC
jgi:hypothetical protein